MSQVLFLFSSGTFVVARLSSLPFIQGFLLVTQAPFYSVYIHLSMRKKERKTSQFIVNNSFLGHKHFSINTDIRRSINYSPFTFCPPIEGFIMNKYEEFKRVREKNKLPMLLLLVVVTARVNTVEGEKSLFLSLSKSFMQLSFITCWN